MMPLELSPRLIEGGVHTDARGTVAFVNDFDFDGVDRFYVIHPRHEGEPRGWVGHRHEQKWFFAIQGTILVAVVKPDDWQQPLSSLPIQRFTLSADNPQVLHVPAGHATASASLRPGGILMVFSSGRVADIKGDDYRFAVDTWPVICEG
jgi:dTDP-4-dehydrorhamnose 3,5-epimerase-like enzyme